MQDVSPKRPEIWLNANDRPFCIDSFTMYGLSINYYVKFYFEKMLTILIEIAARQKKNRHRRWASLPLTTTIACVGPSSSSSPSAQSSPSVHRHIPSHRFISSSSALSSFAVHRARRPMCRNLRGNSISNSKWTAFTYVGISIFSLFLIEGD